MEYLGLLCLGVFTGVITLIGLRRLQVPIDWRQMLVVMLPVLLSGAVIVFSDRFRYSSAVGAFPCGLVLSLLWMNIGIAFEYLRSSTRGGELCG